MRYSYEAFLIELGHRLKQLRREHGFSLRDMVADHDFHFTQWQSFEKGKGISVQTLLKLCEVFEMRLEELVRDIGELEPTAREADCKAVVDEAHAKPKASKMVKKPIS